MDFERGKLAGACTSLEKVEWISSVGMLAGACTSLEKVEWISSGGKLASACTSLEKVEWISSGASWQVLGDCPKGRMQSSSVADFRFAPYGQKL